MKNIESTAIGTSADAIARAALYRMERSRSPAGSIHPDALKAHADEPQPLTRSQSAFVWTTLIVALASFVGICTVIADKAFGLGLFHSAPL